MRACRLVNRDPEKLVRELFPAYHKTAARNTIENNTDTTSVAGFSLPRTDNLEPFRRGHVYETFSLRRGRQLSAVWQNKLSWSVRRTQTLEVGRGDKDSPGLKEGLRGWQIRHGVSGT